MGHIAEKKRTMHTREVANAGCIVTLVNTDTGEERVVHEPGYAIEKLLPRKRSEDPRRRQRTSQTIWQSLTKVVALAESWGPKWRVRSISTPETIYSDLKGRKVGGRGAKHDSDRVPSPEATFLTRIGRPDMWERAE